MALAPLERLRRVRDSFWAIPLGLVIAALLLAQAAVALDHALDPQLWPDGPGGATALGVTGSRGLLTVIGGSMLAVASTSFSITISVIATASATYGPRLVRNFMADRGNQLVLGTFVAAFVYSLVVLRAINAAGKGTGRAAFVPHIAVYLAIVVALGCVVALVWFIHHIAQSIQVSTLIDRVRGELDAVAADQYPQTTPRNAVPATPLGPDAGTVEAGATGYVVWVDEPALLRLARENDGLVEVGVTPGTHVLSTETVARTTCPVDDVASAIRRCIWVDDARTPHQDVGFAVLQLVEVAVRALSPGTNDPYTACNAIAELGHGMTRLAQNGAPPPGRTDEDGRLRLIVARVDVTHLVDAVFDDLRRHGSDELYVVRSALELAGRIARVGDDEVADRVRLQARLLVEAFEAPDRPALDVDRVREDTRRHLGPGVLDSRPA